MRSRQRRNFRKIPLARYSSRLVTALGGGLDELFTERRAWEIQLLANSIDFARSRMVRKQLRLLRECDVKLTRIVFGHHYLRGTHLHIGQAGQLLVLGIQFKMGFANNLGLVLGAPFAPRPIAPGVVLDRLVMRIALLQRLQEIGLARSILSDNTREPICNLNAA